MLAACCSSAPRLRHVHVVWAAREGSHMQGNPSRACHAREHSAVSRTSEEATPPTVAMHDTHAHTPAARRCRCLSVIDLSMISRPVGAGGGGDTLGCLGMRLCFVLALVVWAAARRDLVLVRLGTLDDPSQRRATRPGTHYLRISGSLTPCGGHNDDGGLSVGPFPGL